MLILGIFMFPYQSIYLAFSGICDKEAAHLETTWETDVT